MTMYHFKVSVFMNLLLSRNLLQLYTPGTPYFPFCFSLPPPLFFIVHIFLIVAHKCVHPVHYLCCVYYHIHCTCDNLDKFMDKNRNICATYIVSYTYSVHVCIVFLSIFKQMKAFTQRCSWLYCVCVMKSSVTDMTGSLHVYMYWCSSVWCVQCKHCPYCSNVDKFVW